MSVLFEPIQLGALALPNRILMAPLTRCRSGRERVPNELMLTYYRQRAGAGLIFSEATSVDPMGVGYPDTPGIWSAAQIDGWRAITDAVHEAGGRMVLQLWHVGRVSDPIYLNGQRPLAPSAIAPDGTVSLIRPKKPFVTPRALALEEIPQVIEAYRQGAENAKAAGFDGVEIHAANGYLLDQFLQTASNLRADEYGGSVANRARLLLEVTDAVIGVWGADRVGVHLAPRCDSHDMGDADPQTLFTHVARCLGERHIAFIYTREHFNAPALTPLIKTAFGGPVIANENFTFESAGKVIEIGQADAVGFGKLFIANPDLVERFRRGAPLNEPDANTFYSFGPEGYVDYRTLDG